MDYTDSDIPDVQTSLDIQPYQFEPIFDASTRHEDKNSSSGDSYVDNNSLNDDLDRLVNTTWCECGNCASMETVDECVCCAAISAVNAQMYDDDLQCITQHEVFVANCLNRHVLQVSMYEHLENVGPFDDNQPINERYRYLAYRRFVQWVWRRLGKNNRKVLPACVVLTIRKTFPSAQYCGFKYMLMFDHDNSIIYDLLNVAYI